MPQTVLVTGGAGFIGSHVVDALLDSGYRVRVFDCLSGQVHGESGSVPDYLSKDCEVVVGDMRDPGAVRDSLKGIDMVMHLAAAVGVGQSMYEIENYTAINELGTAVLMEALSQSPVERLVVASSMSIYGEGTAQNHRGDIVVPQERSLEQLKAGYWEIHGPDGEILEPLPTAETKPPALSSLYALNKYAQERMCLIVGRAYEIPTTALRFFNVYGPRQALSNPYTGLLAIFASRLINDRPPLIFEDGQQRRDFVHVRDVARACLLAMESDQAAGEVFNVGSGISRSVCDVADSMLRAMGRTHIEPEITNRYRVGDIRHCFADIRKAQEMLGFEPEVDFDDGLIELADYLADQVAVDRVDQSTAELAARGLVA